MATRIRRDTRSAVEDAGAVRLGPLLAYTVALLSAGAGVIHLSTAGKHLDHAFVASGFVVMALAQLAFAGLVVARAKDLPRRLMLGGVALTGGIVLLWAVTRLTAIGFVPGLEARQDVGIEDAIATMLEVVLLAAAGLWLAAPKPAFDAVVPSARRALSAAAGVTALLLVPGIVVPHDHGSHGHDDHATFAAGHAHGDAKVAHDVADGRGHARDGHLHDPTASESTHAAALQAAGHGMDHAHPAGTSHTEHARGAAHEHAGATSGGHAHGDDAERTSGRDDTHGDDGHSHTGGDDHHGPGGDAHADHMAYQDADCTPVDDAAGDDSVKVLDEREHHMNGRTECVLVDGGGTPVQAMLCEQDAKGDDCYISYNPYQQDMEEGNSNRDRGPAVRYHNGDKYTAGGHHHGTAGCWDPTGKIPTQKADEQGEAEIQRALRASLEMYTGPLGLETALLDGWYLYPVPESKQFHAVRQFWAGERFPEQPTRLHAPNIESFVIGMTDDGWQIMNGMFTLGNEGDETFTYDAQGKVQNGPVDYKLLDDEDKLPVWHSPYSAIVCDLAWHGHTDAEGVATSFDTEHPDISEWMAHVALYAADGDPFGKQRHPDASEPHAYWEPYRWIPAACNPNGPCE